MLLLVAHVTLLEISCHGSLIFISANEHCIQILKDVKDSASLKVPDIHKKKFQGKKQRTQAPLKKIQKLYKDEPSVASNMYFFCNILQKRKGVEAPSYE